LKSRDIVVGLDIDGSSRAYPWGTLTKQSPVVDHVHGTPVLVAVGPDGKSFRVFVSRVDGKDAEFFLKGESEGDAKTAPVGIKPWTLVDTATASEWNFQGCAISGPAQGKCLDRMPALKDYWFDWRNYHPETVIYKR
jgi:hypothetical protein